jgi:hypothetical protein
MPERRCDMNQYIITEEELEEWEAGGMCWSEERDLHRSIRSHPYNPQAERERVLDEIFKKHTKTLEDGWVYDSVLRHKLEHAIVERNEWDLSEEEIEEVLMVFEAELREGKDGE